MELFDQSALQHDLPGTPLAEKMRPSMPEGVLGQASAAQHLARLRTRGGGHTQSLILWGPPGTGKTSYARALIHELKCEVHSSNAIDLGAKELREIGQKAKDDRRAYQQQTVLFVDEIHRLNKSQQDILLPFLESGDLILIGATTENPSYELNRAVMSRCQLIVFERLSDVVLNQLVQTALKKFNLDAASFFAPEAQSALISSADGDARRLLGYIEMIISSRARSTTTSGDLDISSCSLPPEPPITVDQIKEALGPLAIGYDKSGDEHFDLLSAMIKSIRGSDANAGLYYLARMLRGGEPPLVIARRLVVLASEDVGNADPRALNIAVAGAQAVEIVGMPECEINLAQVVTYLASAPKSNRSYLGLQNAKKLVDAKGAVQVPLALRSARTGVMKGLGYGEGYLYPHDFPKSFVEQSYLPDEIVGAEIYCPSDRGFEKQIQEYQKWLKAKGQ